MIYLLWRHSTSPQPAWHFLAFPLLYIIILVANNKSDLPRTAPTIYPYLLNYKTINYNYTFVNKSFKLAALNYIFLFNEQLYTLSLSDCFWSREQCYSIVSGKRQRIAISIKTNDWAQNYLIIQLSDCAWNSC